MRVGVRYGAALGYHAVSKIPQIDKDRFGTILLVSGKVKRAPGFSIAWNLHIQTDWNSGDASVHNFEDAHGARKLTNS